MSERERGSLIQHPRCPFCKDAVQPSDEKIACHGCMAWHHAECWTSHGACSACGVERADAPVQADRRRPAAEGCIVRGCQGTARETPGCKPGEQVSVGGEKLAVDRLCGAHTREGLQDAIRSNQRSVWISAAICVLAVVVTYLAMLDDMASDLLEQVLVMGLLLAACGLPVGLTLWTIRKQKEMLRVSQALDKTTAHKADADAP